MPEIIIIDTRNPQATKTIAIALESQSAKECLVGREERCGIILEDSMVSRTHGKITFRNGDYFFVDLGSRNGSRINNEAAKANQEYQIGTSDTIAIGNHILWVKAIAIEQTTANAIKSLTPSQYMPLATIDLNKLARWTSGTLKVKCVGVIEETADVKTFIFVADPAVLFHYQPGQSVTLNLEIEGKEVKGIYSISSTPSRPHTLEITVKRIPPSETIPTEPQKLANNWLYDEMKVGNSIDIEPPVGEFSHFKHPANKLLLLSAGKGIIPLMSMSRWICDTASDIDFILVHSTCNPKDIIFRQELEMMSARYANFKLAITLTRHQLGQPWYGYRGRLNSSLLSSIAPDYCDRTIYVSGSSSFMEAAKSWLEELDFPLENYYDTALNTVKSQNQSRLSALPMTAPAPTLEGHTSMVLPAALTTQQSETGSS